MELRCRKLRAIANLATTRFGPRRRGETMSSLWKSGWYGNRPGRQSDRESTRLPPCAVLVPAAIEDAGGSLVLAARRPDYQTTRLT